jgi:hypothetical protein
MLGNYGGLWRCALMILGLAGLSGAGGCASIMSGGGMQRARVNSTPAGAAVKIDWLMTA